MAKLAIDHGWSMGWCLKTRRGMASGVLHSRDGNRTDGARLLAQSDFFTSLLKRLEAAGESLDEIVYERVTFIGKNDADTVHAHGKQLGNLQRWAELKGQPEPLGIEVRVIKKHVTDGRMPSASRDKVFELVSAAFPSVTDKDQASAVAIMLTATNQKLPQPSEHPSNARQAKVMPADRD